MNFKETLALKRKEREEQEAKEKIIAKEKITSIPAAVIPKAPVVIKNESQVSFVPTLDAIRGLLYFVTLIGDKTATKSQLEKRLKEILLTPQGFGTFMENIAKYLKTVN